MREVVDAREDQAEQGPGATTRGGPGEGSGWSDRRPPPHRRHARQYAARSWKALHRVIGRVEASPQGSDSRFIVTNLAGAPRWLYESVYCVRGLAANLIEAHKLHLA